MQRGTYLPDPVNANSVGMGTGKRSERDGGMDVKGRGQSDRGSKIRICRRISPLVKTGINAEAEAAGSEAAGSCTPDLNELVEFLRKAKPWQVGCARSWREASGRGDGYWILKH